MAYEPLSVSNTASTTPTATGAGYVPLVAPAKTAPPAVSTKPTGYQPISSVGLITPKTNVAPVSTVKPQSSSAAIPASALKGSLGGGYGASNEKDSSGKPLLTYENQKAQSSQLLKDRVAPTFDPTVPQKIDPKVLENGRMPESASEAVRQATGADPDEQLDHLISLELGGSNDPSNLNLELGTNTTTKNPKGVQPSLALENQTAKDVASGKISYIDGQKIIARAKGVQLPDDPDFSSSAHPLAKDYPNPAPNQTGTKAQQPATTSPVSKIENWFSSLANRGKVNAANPDPLSPAARIVHDSVLSYLAGVTISSNDTSGDFKAKMSDQQIADAASGAKSKATADLATAGYSPEQIQQTMNTPLPVGDGHTLGDLPRTILQTTTRAGLGYGASLLGEDQPLQPGEIPSSKISPTAQMAIYGSNPVTPFASQADIAQARQGNLQGQRSIALAAVGLGFNTVIDPASFGEDALAQLAEETDPEKIVTILTNKGIDEDAARTIAPIISKASTNEQVKGILTAAAEHGLIYGPKTGGTSAADEFAAQEAGKPQAATPELDTPPTEAPTPVEPVTKASSGEANPNLTPEQSQSIAASGKQGSAAADWKDQAEQAAIREHNALGERAASEPPVPQDSALQKAKNWLNPLKQQDPETKEIFERYTKKLAAARPLANEQARKLSNIPQAEGWDAVLREERGQASPHTAQIKGTFQDLLAEGRSRGLDIPDTKNYVPHVYAENGQQIRQVMKNYLVKKGVPKADVEELMQNGKPIPEDTAKRLGLNPFFAKTRIFPTYPDAMNAGLHPRFTHPAQLAGYYREQMEIKIANRELTEELAAKGKLLPVELAPRGYHAVNLEFSPKAYYAKPRLAEMLNGLFHDQNAVSFPAKVASVVGKASATIQKVGLTTGVPGTSLNLHSLGQIIMHITAGDLKGLAPFVRSNVNGASVKFFVNNADYLKRMAAQGIDVGKTVADFDRMYPNLLKPGIRAAADRGGAKSVAAFITKQAGTAFSNAFSRKNFTSLMPQFLVQTFKDASDRFVAKGMTQEAADALAAQTTKAFHGLIGNIGRAQGTEDVLSSAFYAPPFRESILKTLWNSLEGDTTQIKNPAFYKNRRLLAGIALSYGLYVAANKKLSGHYMWDNPSGHEFDLQIPTGNSNYAYVPFMPTFLTVPRDVAAGAIDLAQGNFKDATSQFSGILSAPLQLFGQLYANKDFYGRAIYADTDPRNVKIAKIAQYLGLNAVPPFVKEAVTYIENRSTTPFYQAMTTGLALPIKYGTDAQNNTSDFYNALTNYDSMHAQAIAAFKPTFDKIQQLKASGQTDQAQQILNGLSDSDYTLYKDALQGSKTSATTKAEAQFMPSYRSIRALVAQGKTDQAQQALNGLSASDYKLYQALMKKNIQ